jgi:Tfp pilus assembly protein PilO
MSNKPLDSTITPLSADAKAPRRSGSLLIIHLAGVATCLLMAGAWHTLTLAPLKEARESRQALWDALQPRLEKAASLEQHVRAQQRTLAAVGEQIASGDLQLRSVDYINQRIADITAAAGAFKLRLEEVRPGTPAAMQWFMNVPIRLSGSGEYPDLGSFLHALPAAFPDVAVVGFQVRGEPEAIDKTPRFELNLVWYAAPRSAGVNP